MSVGQVVGWLDGVLCSALIEVLDSTGTSTRAIPVGLVVIIVDRLTRKAALHRDMVLKELEDVVPRAQCTDMELCENAGHQTRARPRANSHARDLQTRIHTNTLTSCVQFLHEHIRANTRNHVNPRTRAHAPAPTRARCHCPHGWRSQFALTITLKTWKTNATLHGVSGVA